jgi:hypothetical protein
LSMRSPNKTVGEGGDKVMDLRCASSIADPARAHGSRAHGGGGQMFRSRFFNKETIMTQSQKTTANAQRSAKPAPPKSASKNPSKLDTLEALFTRTKGTSIAERMRATGWQQHSIRGALAGALKKRLTITSTKADGERRYQGSAL